MDESEGVVVIATATEVSPEPPDPPVPPVPVNIGGEYKVKQYNLSLDFNQAEYDNLVYTFPEPLDVKLEQATSIVLQNVPREGNTWSAVPAWYDAEGHTIYYADAQTFELLQGSDGVWDKLQ